MHRPEARVISRCALCHLGGGRRIERYGFPTLYLDQRSRFDMPVARSMRLPHGRNAEPNRPLVLPVTPPPDLGPFPFWLVPGGRVVPAISSHSKRAQPALSSCPNASVRSTPPRAANRLAIRLDFLASAARRNPRSAGASAVLGNSRDRRNSRDAYADWNANPELANCNSNSNSLPTLTLRNRPTRGTDTRLSTQPGTRRIGHHPLDSRPPLRERATARFQLNAIFA